jgi:hypothetical protein
MLLQNYCLVHVLEVLVMQQFRFLLWSFKCLAVCSNGMCVLSQVVLG